MRKVIGLATAAMLLCAAGQDQAPSRDELVVSPDELVASEVEGEPAQLHIVSAGPDRLVLNQAFVTRHGLSPAGIMGRADLSVSGRREFKGYNRPVPFAVGGRRQRTRAFWFVGAPPSVGDGSVGPWVLPQSKVTFVLAPLAAGQGRYDMPLTGGIDSASLTGWKEASFGMTVAFDLDSAERYPVATAAAGAAIAAAYGGTLSGPSWDFEVGMGVRRPVRLMTLARPFAMPPFAFTRIAVRVRDRVDEAGRGEAIREEGQVDDPDEIVVTANWKGRPPAFGLTIPRPALAACARLSFDKAAKRVSLWCRPSQG
ncbi:hypothetical protein [Sphingomonas sp.]|uniref:hypothetical protein n=1 Tax=Sphingomonas sp. TaxID=28214 RepID=UPI001B2E2CB8|nr:hypothetical protein [Sphingomonas sp.]MBO9712739.1 hypothetical protein [Sphingomonas sp.]